MVHRDIKPGNILRYVDANEQVTYKLGDFGNAKILTNGQRYDHIYGTPEYMHPDVFAKVYFDKLSKLYPIDKSDTFCDKHDLWSIGVTVFQMATGNVCFQPIRGREDPVYDGQQEKIYLGHTGRK